MPRVEARRDWQIALAFTVGLRLFYSALAAAFVPFLRPDPLLIHSNALTENLPPPHGLYYALIGIWERFDTLWFLRIAEHGYDRPMAVIFYPLYPAAIRVASLLLPPGAAALLVTTVAAFFSFWGLLRLAGTSSDSRKIRTLVLFCAWPASFVLFAGYSDSLTLALVVWAVIFARERHWEAATACGILAGAARPSGVLVVIPLAIAAVRSRQVRSLIVTLTPIGLLSYWGWLRWTGRPSVVDAYRLYQGMTMAPPWKGLAEVLHLIGSEQDLLLGVKFGLLIVIIVLGFRGTAQTKVFIEDQGFALAIALQMLMYTGRPLLGAARYVLLVYPAFLVLGSIAERWNIKQLVFYASALSLLNLAWMWAFLNWRLVL